MNSFNLHLIILLLIGVESVATAQSNSDWTTVIKSTKYEKDNSVVKLLVDKDNKLYTVMNKKSGAVLNIHNNDMNVEKEIKLLNDGSIIEEGADFISQEKNVVEKVLFLNNKVHILYSNLNKKTNSQILTYTLIEDDKESEPKELTSRYCDQFNYIDQSSFVVINSPNNNFFAVVYLNQFKKEMEKNNMVIIIYDSLLNVFNKKEFNYNIFKPGKVSRSSMILSNSGEIVLKYRVSNDSKVENYISVLKQGSNDFTHVRFDFNSKKISETAIKQIDKNKFILSGLYCDKEDASPSGVFTKILDISEPSLTQVDHSEFKIVLDYEADIKIAKQLEKNYSYIIGDPIIHPDQSVTFLFEQFVGVRIAGSNSSTTHTSCADIVLVQVESNGKIKWVTSCKKDQYGINNRAYDSYVAFCKESNFYLIFNDNIKNIANYDPENLEKMTTGNSGGKGDGNAVVIEKYDSKGERTRNVLIKDPDDEFAGIIPLKSITRNDKAYLLFKESQSVLLTQDLSKNFYYLKVEIK